jgi:integrase/recombinase XerD
MAAKPLEILHSRLPVPQSDLQTLADLAVLSLNSPSSRRNYARCIRLFLASGASITRSGIQGYLNSLRLTGGGAVTLNVTLAAIRLLAREAEARSLLSLAEMAAIERIKGVPIRGTRTGNWLDLEGVKALIDTAKLGMDGVRNAALIACMVGCGLRRAEVCALTWDQWQMREGRWCFIDLCGKGGRIRTVPAPRWVADYVEAWHELTQDRRLFALTPQSAFLIVRDTARGAGLGPLAPHDLRRTCSKLMRSGGASIEQISRILGHVNIATTERYLGTDLELREGLAAVDYIRLDDLQCRSYGNDIRYDSKIPENQRRGASETGRQV